MKYFLSLKSLEGHGDKNLSGCNSISIQFTVPQEVMALLPSANSLQL